MAPAAAARFAARPVATLVDELADAFGWPRSRPARLLAGERAANIGRLVICSDEVALGALVAPADAAVLLATPPATSDGRLGRRVYDPFAGTDTDVASWRRSERVVLDASLLLSGGEGGVDDRLAQSAGLQHLPGHRRLIPVRMLPRDVAKFVGYVPTTALTAVRDAVFDAGAGTIGDYDRCSWSTTGTGTFRGGEGTNPTVGARGEFEQVEETRFEAVVPRHLIDTVCRAFVAAHPYEEPAYDVVSLEIPAASGFGRIGVLGAGGGTAAWSALSETDPELAAYGKVDTVAAGRACVVYSGPLRDVLDAVLRVDDLGLIVTGGATDIELELLAARDVAVLALDRSRAVDAYVTDIAGMLTRTLTLPVSATASLQFPEETHLPIDDASVFEETIVAAGAADYTAGTWRMHFDGGSRGNPGPAAYGWVLYDPNGIEHEADGVQIGTATNNVAEWTGLLRGLEHALARGIRTLSIRGDSELVVKQVTGVYKVKNAALKPLAEDVAALIRRFDRVDVKHVYRDENARADEVANEAMDGLR